MVNGDAIEKHPSKEVTVDTCELIPRRIRDDCAAIVHKVHNVERLAAPGIILGCGESRECFPLRGVGCGSCLRTADQMCLIGQCQYECALCIRRWRAGLANRDLLFSPGGEAVAAFRLARSFEDDVVLRNTHEGGEPDSSDAELMS